MGFNCLFNKNAKKSKPKKSSPPWWYKDVKEAFWFMMGVALILLTARMSGLL